MGKLAVASRVQNAQPCPVHPLSEAPERQLCFKEVFRDLAVRREGNGMLNAGSDASKRTGGVEPNHSQPEVSQSGAHRQPEGATGGLHRHGAILGGRCLVCLHVRQAWDSRGRRRRPRFVWTR
jgi:hypothetical protein